MEMLTKRLYEFWNNLLIYRLKQSTCSQFSLDEWTKNEEKTKKDESFEEHTANISIYYDDDDDGNENDDADNDDDYATTT